MEDSLVTHSGGYLFNALTATWHANVIIIHLSTITMTLFIDLFEMMNLLPWKQVVRHKVLYIC